MKDPMKYGKAKGIVLLQKYLPKLSPFKSIDIVSNIDEWNAIKDKFGDFVPNRVDYPIGEPKRNAIAGTNGLANKIPSLIESVNKQTANGIVLLLPTKENVAVPPRYEDDGGFNVLFNMGNNVIIELVGKGFDGHEVTQGLANHERYQIPWDEVLFMRNRKDMIKSPTVQKSHVTHEEYKKQRQSRVKFLYEIVGYDLETIEKNVPKTYNLISDDIIKKLLDDVVLELMKKRQMILRDGLTLFGVQGNIIDGNIQPWEIFRAERLVTRDIEMKR